MSPKPLRFTQFKADCFRWFAQAVVYLVCVILICLGAGIGYGVAHLQKIDEIAKLNFRHQEELLQVKGSQPTPELLERVEKVESTADQALNQVNEVKKTIDKQKRPR